MNPRKWMSALVGVLIFHSALAWGADAEQVQFSVTVDRTQIGEDETVSLKFSVRVDGTSNTAEPQFSAPHFEEVNRYSGVFVESYYENGNFGVRNNRQFTRVLRPLKTGSLVISGIQVSVGGKAHKSNPITIHVGGGGAGTPIPRNYGGSGIGLRGAGKKDPGRNFFVRAEIDKDRAYKGEQVIVSYSLYRRVRVFNIQVEKYPVLDGFLREDLEIPVLGQRLESEQVMLDGVPYERALLARYAAYPLKEGRDGKVKIDSMGIKASYSPGSDLTDDAMDPFATFFQQIAPRTNSVRSESISLEVLPLPTEGRPASFSGGVGDFTVTSGVDKYSVRANEALSLTVKVEGQGNVASISEPKVAWPEGVEVFEVKAKAKSGKGGVGEKIFEFTLIPRQPGKFAVPKMEFGFFSPSKREYFTRAIDSIEIEVLQSGAAENLAAQNGVQNGAPNVAQNAKQEMQMSPLRSLGAPGNQTTQSGRGVYQGKLLRVLPWLGYLAFGVVLGFVAFDFGMRRMRGGWLRPKVPVDSKSKSWDRLAERGKRSQTEAWPQIVQSYELFAGAIYDLIDRHFALGSRGVARSELRQRLVVELGLTESIWNRIDQALAYAEMVRFASKAGVVSESEARTRFSHWILEGRAIEENLAQMRQ